jgi:hypothetical protein
MTSKSDNLPKSSFPVIINEWLSAYEFLGGTIKSIIQMQMFSLPSLSL